MNTTIRFNLINKVALYAYKGYYDTQDLMWVIGMLSDVRISDDMLITEIEKVKTEFPEFVEMLTF
jgi:hypothetical protein